MSTKHAIDDLHPAERVAQRESAAWIHDLMGELRRRGLDDRDLPFRDFAGSELPLGETEVAGAAGGQHTAGPRLFAQPRQCAVGVGWVNGESVELSAGAAGSAQAHIQHLVAAFSQQLRHPVHATPRP